MISALAACAYTLAGQAASALHSMVVLKVFQTKLLWCKDEADPDPAAFRELRCATDLALCATKACLLVLERHLWLMLMEIKDVDKVPFLDSPVYPTGLFGPTVEGFAERFTAAKKSSQAMRHFLPKRSSSAAGSSCPRSTPSPQPAKTVPPATQPEPKPVPLRHRPSPKCHGPRPKIVLDPAPKAFSWSMGQEEGGAKSCGFRTNPQAVSVELPSTPFSSGCRAQCLRSHWARTSHQTAYRSYGGYNKTQTFSKREQISPSTQHEWLVPTWRQTAWSNPTHCHAGWGLAGHPRGLKLDYGDN